MDLVMVSDMADHLENHEDPDQWARLILYPAENKEANVGCRLPQISCHGQHLWFQWASAASVWDAVGLCQRLDWVCARVPQDIHVVSAFLCTDVTHCIRFHYNGWHSNKAISSLNTVFIRPLQEKHNVKCTRKIRCHSCKFSRGMQFRVHIPWRCKKNDTKKYTWWAVST